MRGAGAEANDDAEINAGLPDIADGHRMEVDDGGATEPHLSATYGGAIDEDGGAIASNGGGDGDDDGLLRDEHAEDVVDVGDDDVVAPRLDEEGRAAWRASSSQAQAVIDVEALADIPPRIISPDVSLQGRADVTLCDMLNYSLDSPAYERVDGMMCGLNNLSLIHI